MVSVRLLRCDRVLRLRSSDGNCPRSSARPVCGHKAFSDFILFVHEATLVATSGGSGRGSGGNFVYSVR
jgi:hypothetical protein